MPVPEDDIIRQPPSEKYLRFQKQLSYHSLDAPIQTGHVKLAGTDVQQTPFWEDYAEIFHLATDLELSDEKGFKVLNKFQSILRRHDFSVPLPKLAKQ